jgi:DNA-directed RNA polymerase III subunit RPC2
VFVFEHTVPGTHGQRCIINLCACSEDVNIVIVMRAMGVESDEEVLQLVGTEGPFAARLTPTLQHCKEEGVYTRQQALDYLASKVKGGGRPPGNGGSGGGTFMRRTRSRVDEARDILANVVLCHVPVVHFDYQQKVRPSACRFCMKQWRQGITDSIQCQSRMLAAVPLSFR